MAATVDDRVAEVAGWIRQARSVVALTGAGISTDSGIPDFRGPQGLWTRDPDAERKATIQAWMSDPELRRERWRGFAAGGGRFDAEPNDGHRALAALERAGHLDVVVTQNVDGLHQAAGCSPERVVEVHGTLREYTCLSCGDRGPIDDVFERVRAGDEDPHCACGGLLKSATISFGQSLEPAVVERAQEAAGACDVFLALGTSLVVYPVAFLPQLALRAGARLVIANADPTPMDDEADAVLLGPLGRTLPALAEAVTGHRS